MFNIKFKNIVVALSVLTLATLACKLLTGEQQSESPIPTQNPIQVDTSTTSSCSPFDGIAKAGQYNTAPDLLISTNGKYTATIRMAKGGDIVIELYASQAPITVNSFIFLACKGFYDGTTFHRVLEDFMAQGGDPTGTGSGGPGYEFVNENSDLKFDKAGVVAMANAGPDTNGSQFFITFGPAEYLNGGYTIFGQVVQGMDVVTSITLRDPDRNPSSLGDAMESVTISGQ